MARAMHAFLRPVRFLRGEGVSAMRLLTCVVAAATSMAALAAAQSPAPVPDKDAKLVKVIGCLSGGPSKFILTNAAPADAPARGERPTGTAGVVTSYDLNPRDGVSLAPHIGHRVEVTGVVGDVTKAPAGDAPPQPGRPRDRGLTAQFAVTSVRMVSPICLE